MRVYVASKFEEYPRVRAVMGALIDAGHTITYNWTNCKDFTNEQAVKDLKGVMTADALVFIAERDLSYRGAYVELGIAIARGIPIYVMGRAADQCIFLKLPQVQYGIAPLLTVLV